MSEKLPWGQLACGSQDFQLKFSLQQALLKNIRKLRSIEMKQYQYRLNNYIMILIVSRFSPIIMIVTAFISLYGSYLLYHMRISYHTRMVQRSIPYVYIATANISSTIIIGIVEVWWGFWSKIISLIFAF